jgi:hypothetical protein
MSEEINRIWGRADLNGEARLDTLLHECLHVLDYDMQLDLTERQVHSLAAGIYMILRDNPDFLALIASGGVAPTS